MDPTKKISFGFSKSKSAPIKPKPEVKTDMQFIDCIEKKAIKIKGFTPVRKEQLVIPLKTSNSPKQEFSDKLDDKKNTDTNESNVSQNVKQDDEHVPSGSTNSLEDLAVKEILEDSTKVKEKTREDLLITPKNVKVSDVETTISDYENVPVSQFGLAMLRGMGWKPEKGIGKNEKIVEPTQPVLRPKGMGLGVEKRKITAVSSSQPEDCELKKGSLVMVVAGTNKNTYGQVQSFDEDVGRVIIKTALGGTNISVNEGMVQVVSKEEYKKSSRVLNMSKYEDYKRREEKHYTKEDSSENKRQKKYYRIEENGRHSP